MQRLGATLLNTTASYVTQLYLEVSGVGLLRCKKLRLEQDVYLAIRQVPLSEIYYFGHHENERYVKVILLLFTNGMKVENENHIVN